MEFITDLYSFMVERKKFWIVPLMLILLLVVGLLVLAEGSAVAPFIYTLF